MGRTRSRKEMANAPPWTAKPAGPSRDALLDGVREMLTWSVALCAYEDGRRDGEIFRAADVLRTRQMLAEAVKLLSRHEAERRRRVREARIASLLPRLVELLESPPVDPRGVVNVKAMKASIVKEFDRARVLLSRAAVDAVSALAVSTTDKLEKPGTKRRSQKAIARVLKDHKAVKCSPSTLANYRYALEEGTKGRKGAAVHGELTMRALLEARRVDSIELLRFAVLAVGGKGNNEELASGVSEFFDYLPDAAKQERAEWF